MVVAGRPEQRVHELAIEQRLAVDDFVYGLQGGIVYGREAGAIDDDTDALALAERNPDPHTGPRHRIRKIPAVVESLGDGDRYGDTNALHAFTRIRLM